MMRMTTGGSGLAESWEYDEETCTYTFHIRDGVKWHDGEKFTADDVKFTIEAIMDPETVLKMHQITRM